MRTLEQLLSVVHLAQMPQDDAKDKDDQQNRTDD